MHQFPLLAVSDRYENLLHYERKFVFCHRFCRVAQDQLNHWFVAWLKCLHQRVYLAFTLVYVMNFLNALLIN